MAYQGISTGSGPNRGDGDTLIDGAKKINSNFQEIYNTLGNGSVLGNASLTSLSVNSGRVTISAGIITATSGVTTYYGDASLTSLSVNNGRVTISAGIITATSGVTTYYGDGTYLTFSSASFDEKVDDRVNALIVAGTGIQKTYDDNANTYTLALDFTEFTTTNITEGTNQYFTTTRARSSISASGSLSYNPGTGVISYTTPTTSAITEGTNLYYTDERAQDAIGAAINAGIQTGITVTYNDSSNKIDFNVTSSSPFTTRGFGMVL